MAEGTPETPAPSSPHDHFFGQLSIEAPIRKIDMKDRYRIADEVASVALSRHVYLVREVLDAVGYESEQERGVRKEEFQETRINVIIQKIAQESFLLGEAYRHFLERNEDKWEIEDAEDAATIVDTALLKIYTSKEPLSYTDLIISVSDEAMYRIEDVTRVVDHMDDFKTPLISFIPLDPNDETPDLKAAFSTAGLWALENSRMYNEGLQPVERTIASIDVLAKGFFDDLVDTD